MFTMNKYNDLTKIIHKDTDTIDVVNAYKMSLSEYSKEDIMRILAENNDEIKLIPIINVKSIDTANELKLILSHLTGKDGRIREAVSFILSENPECMSLVQDEKINQIIVQGLMDINPNVARNIINLIEKNKPYKKIIESQVIKKTEKVLEELSKYIKNDSPYKENKEKSQKNHAKNKLTFNLYWLLSTIAILDVNNIKNLEKILTKTSAFLDYTIREKTALILSKMNNPPKELLQKLQQDENIYVKNQLL